MRRSAAIVARFLLFHILSVFTTAILLLVLSEFMTAASNHQPVDWVSLSQGFIVVSAMEAPLAAAMLLIPSALGWWAGGVWLKHVDGPLNFRPAGQGTIAALAGVASMVSMLIWLNNMARQGKSGAPDQTVLADLIALLPLLLGLPIGAFFGWLVYRRIWPSLPAPALR